MSKRKPWVVRDDTRALCGHCGARSFWRPGVPYCRHLWKWWTRFKRTHSKCVLRSIMVTLPNW